MKYFVQCIQFDSHTHIYTLLFNQFYFVYKRSKTPECRVTITVPVIWRSWNTTIIGIIRSQWHRAILSWSTKSPTQNSVFKCPCMFYYFIIDTINTRFLFNKKTNIDLYTRVKSITKRVIKWTLTKYMPPKNT